MSSNAKKIALLALLTILAISSLTACTSTKAQRGGDPMFGPDLSRTAPAGTAKALWSQWLLGGDSAEALQGFQDRLGQTQPGPDQDLDDQALAYFGIAEIERHQGHPTKATQGYLALLMAHPDHPLSRWAAARLWELREHDPNWLDAIKSLDKLHHSDRLSHATRAWLRWSALRASYLEDRNTFNDHYFNATAQGMPQDWSIAGPFSLYPLHDRGQDPTTIKDDLTLADQYEINGHTEKTLHFVADEPFIDPLVARTGVYMLESWVSLQGDPQWLIHLQSEARLKVWIDDKLVFSRVDDSYQPQRMGTTINAPEGLHRIRIKLFVELGSEQFKLQFVSPTGGTVNGAMPSSNSSLQTISSDQPLPAQNFFKPALTQTQAKGQPFLQWLLAETSLAEGNHVQALDAVTLAPEASSLTHFTWGNILRQAPSYAEQNRQDLAIARYRQALELDPKANFAATRLSAHLHQQENLDEALTLLDNVTKDPDASYLAHYRLFQLFSERGWTSKARTALKAAIAAYPSNCSLTEQQWSEWASQDIWPNPQSFTPEMLACDITQEHLANNYDLPRGNTKSAISRYEKLTARNPRSVRYRQTLAQLYQRTGDTKKAAETFDEAGRLGLSSVGAQLLQYDNLLATEPAKAQQYLKEKLAQNQGNYDLRRALQLSKNSNVMENLRVDPMPLIQRYEAAPKETDTSGVYLLDYAATRVFKDGSALTLTHTLIRVQNKAGIDQFGEVSVPDSALLMKLRTIKPDGRTMEPEFIPGKPNISMPNLEPGDTIELEYLENTQGSYVRKGTYLGFRFYFNIFDAPLLRSEYILELPKEWKPIMDKRNGAPSPEITVQDTHKRYRFLTRQNTQAAQEPGSVPSTEFLPSVQTANAYQWGDAYRAYRDRLLAQARHDAPMKHWVDTLIENKTSEDAKARALFKGVVDAISDDSSGPFAQPAAHIFHAKTGDRMMALKTMLDLAGIRNEFVMGRTWTQDQNLTAIPDIDNWTYLVLRAWPDGKETWMDPTVNHAIYGFIPFALQGNKGLSMGPHDQEAMQGDTPKALFVDIPHMSAESDLRKVSLSLVLSDQGKLTGQGEESYTGSGASLLRRIVDSYTDRDELIRALEQSMGATFPGLEVQRLDLEGLEDDQAPLVMKYRFVSENFARRQGDTLLIERGLFATNMAIGYASLPERRTPLLISEPVRMEMKVFISFPEGWTVTQGPPPADVETSFGGFKRQEKSVSRAQDLSWSQVLWLPLQRVSVENYEAFRSFAQQVDDGERLRLQAKKK